MTSDSRRPFQGLGPDLVLQAAESVGLIPDGRLLSLNSYENRVFQVGLADGEPVVAKFYRPERWTDAAILEEHAFSLELADHGLPVVAPLIIAGKSLHPFSGFRMAVFPRRGGHAPEPAHEPTLRHLGRVLGRMHAVGAASAFRHREVLDIQSRGREPVGWLLENDWIPPHLVDAFESLAGHALDGIEGCFERAGDYSNIRVHGDCHSGNMLWRDDRVHFVDLDDCLTAPAVQDLWMLISGDRGDRERQLNWLLAEYTVFCEFDPRQLHLIEALRTLRMLHFQAWLARRWEDPAFPAAFPWFEDARHWETVIGQLREQLGELAEPPLELTA